MQRTFAPIVVGLALMTGCIGVSTEFQPRTAVPHPAVAEQAVRFYEGDVDAIRAAGGEVIGTLNMRGNGLGRPFVGQSSLADRAATKAAERGGTHFILTDSGTNYTFTTTPGRETTSCVTTSVNVNCSSTYTPPAQQVHSDPKAEFAVVRVPPSGWASLPPALQPNSSSAK